jgi:two-component system, LuxR family, response regulator FixJ
MPNQTIKPSVFIVDDDNELCQSLQFLLESVGLQVKTFNNAHDFLVNFQPTQTGCILLDIRMPLMSGLELQEQLTLNQNTLPIIFMTGHGDVPMAVRAMKAGAFDFLTKPFNDQTMLDQIQKAITQHQKIATNTQQHITANANFKTLTSRERGVLQLIVQGKLNKEIAFELDISIKTVELHRSHVMQKMQAATVADLVKLYMLVPESSKAEMVD